MGRLIVVSNRLPVSVSRQGGDFVFTPSSGGLVTGLQAVARSRELLWVGWCGMASGKLADGDKGQLRDRLADDNLYPVFLTKNQIEDFYHGFSNKTIWPLFHYFPLYTAYQERFWESYVAVNRAFREIVRDVARPGDQIWVHDYQLMLLPRLIRNALPDAHIGFFLHIPWPSYELFRVLPWRGDILNGLLGADVIGFHTYDYVRHFLSSASRIAGVEHTLGELAAGDRMVKVDAFPMGIDYEKYSKAPEAPEVRKEIQHIRRKLADQRLIISIDRLDYTKGIVQRLEAFDLFLTQNPQYKGKVTLILLAVPSRAGIERYQTLRRQLEALVGRINGEHGSIGWAPVWYLYRTVSFERLVALYRLADVALVTPLRDGMNLIAKEFVAAKGDCGGVLVLSEMAGAASELGEAVTVNANSKGEIIRGIKEALEMPQDEQVRRNRLMQKRLSRYTVSRWADEFLVALETAKEMQANLSVRRLRKERKEELIGAYREGARRLLLLDYDGTLVTFCERPEAAVPDAELMRLLGDLAGDARNDVVIVSGRDRRTLDEWLGRLNVAMVAEHGAWLRDEGGSWRTAGSLRNNWKDTIRPILELYTDRTPGSSVEEKDFSLVWHCRGADPELAYVRTQELRDAVLNLTANLDVGIFEGHKIFEIKPSAVNKGRAAGNWLQKNEWDFILAAGDDYTDEDMFAVMPERAYSIRVGYNISQARFNIGSVTEVRALLTELTES